MALDPAKLAIDLADDYTSYLRGRFYIKDRALREQFGALLGEGRRLHQGPFVELVPPFALGSTVRDLVSKGILDSGLLRVSPSAMLPDRPLYLHQQQAIEKEQAGRNVIDGAGPS